MRQARPLQAGLSLDQIRGTGRPACSLPKIERWQSTYDLHRLKAHGDDPAEEFDRVSRVKPKTL
jgi:hypothetical protein